jgi:tetratricopeptide (TPR) repeat protein
VLNIFGGRIADAREAGRPALEIAVERQDDQLAYGARFALGQSCWCSGDYREGIEILTPNLPENLANPDQIRDFAIAGSLALDSLAMISGCHAQLGEFDRAFAIFQQMHDLIGQIQATAFDHMVMGSHPPRALLLRGDCRPAIPILEMTRKLVIEAGMRFSLPWETGFLGHAKVIAGDVDEGVALLEESLKDCAAIYFSAIIRVLFADGLLAQGKITESLEAANENLRLCRDLGYQAHEAETLRVMASALAASDISKAEECARQALELSGSLGMRPEQAHGLRVLAEIQDRRGNSHAARDAKARAEGIYRELKMTRWLQTPDAAPDG